MGFMLALYPKYFIKFFSKFIFYNKTNQLAEFAHGFNKPHGFSIKTDI